MNSIDISPIVISAQNPNETHLFLSRETVRNFADNPNQVQ